MATFDSKVYERILQDPRGRQEHRILCLVDFWFKPHLVSGSASRKNPALSARCRPHYMIYSNVMIRLCRHGAGCIICADCNIVAVCQATLYAKIRFEQLHAEIGSLSHGRMNVRYCALERARACQTV